MFPEGIAPCNGDARNFGRLFGRSVETGPHAQYDPAMCRRVALLIAFLSAVPATAQAKKPDPQRIAAAEQTLNEFGCKLHRDEKAPGKPYDLVWFPKKTGDRDAVRLLREVRQLGTVRMIDLGDTHVTDLSMRELAKQTELESIYLDHTAITDAGLKELAALPRLVWLDMMGTKLTSASADTLAGVKTLSHLFLGVKLDASDVAKLAGLGRLQSLALTVRDPDAALREISKLPDLKELRLNAAPIGPGYADLAKFTGLEKLQLRGGLGIIPADGWKTLAELPKLRDIDLGVHDQEDKAQYLQWVDDKREQKPKPWPATADGLARLRDLKALDLTGTAIGDDAFKTIGKLTSLEELYLTCTQVSLAGAKESLSGLTKLRILKVRNAEIADAGLRSLEGLKSLELLWIVNNRFSEDGANRLQKALPRCSIWWKYSKAGDGHTFRVPGGYGGGK
jgi:Leucine-rich repeat (LRR) protein